MTSSLAPGASDRLSALYSVMHRLLVALKSKDTYGFFLEPVDPEQVPDYLSIIKNPMDFSTMGKKITAGAFGHLREFQSDFELICSNAMTYNAPNTIYYRNAQKLLEYGRRLIARESLKWSDKLNKISGGTPPKRSKRMTSATSDDGSDGEGAQEDLHDPKRLALYKRNADGTFSFSSLNKKPGPLNIVITKESDGSIGSNAPDWRTVLIHPSRTYGARTLGSSASILASQILALSKTSQSTARPMPVDVSGPMTFSPFYDSAGYPIPLFDSPGLALAYGDPKGRAYLESLEKFLLGVCTESAKERAERLTATLSLGGHPYVRGVEEWKDSFFTPSQSAKKEKTAADTGVGTAAAAVSIDDDSSLAPESTAIASPTVNTNTHPNTSASAGGSAHVSPSTSTTLGNVSSLSSPVLAAASPVHTGATTSSSLRDQVRSDLNQMARLLRWKRIEPEMEKLYRQSPMSLVKQFVSASSASKSTSSSRAASPSQGMAAEGEEASPRLRSLDEQLRDCSSLILSLQSLQNERFKSGKPSHISVEEKNLVHGLKNTLQELAGHALPKSLVRESTLAESMTKLTEARNPPEFQGTFPQAAPANK